MEHLARNPLELAIVERAEAQWGLLHRADLLELGLGVGALRYRVATGRLHPLHPGVFALGHRAISRRADYLAAVWWCGGDGALAGESATAFYGWTREDADHPPPVHVVTTRARSSRPGVVVHRTRSLPPEDVLTFERLLRVTGTARTLVDRADRLSYRALRALADAPRAFPKAELQRVHAGLPGRAGWSRTQRLIASEDAHAKSALERRATAYLVRHEIRLPDRRNERVAGNVADCIYDDERLVLELDSRAHHARRREMLEDKRRDRRYLLAGWTPVRLMWEELDPDDPFVAGELRRFLAGGLSTRCAV